MKTKFIVLVSCLLFGKAANAVVKVEMRKADKTVALLELPNGLVKIMAKEIEQETTTRLVTLSGGCSVTVVQDKDHKMQFSGDNATVSANLIEVQVDGGFPFDIANMPFVNLKDAINKTPNLQLFRIGWGVSVGSWLSWGTSVYDKKNQTVKEFWKGGDWKNQYLANYFYKGVTPEIMQQFLDNGMLKGGGPFSFSKLMEYGATREELPAKKHE